MSSPERSQMPNPESIQRFNDLVDNCLNGARPFEMHIDGEQEIATAELPLPDHVYVHADDSYIDETHVPEIVREHSITAERHLTAARAIRRLRIVERAVNGSYPVVLETASDEPDITFRYENPSYPQQQYEINTDFLDAQISRVERGIQYKLAGH